ncbi:MAG: hypothetical protein ABIJ84_04065 [bacterium]
MNNYIQQGKGKIVRIRFASLGHILDLEGICQRLFLVLRVPISAINDGIEFDWSQQVYASDETVNIKLNEILSKNPDAEISFR